jgi:hypothetical protein
MPPLVTLMAGFIQCFVYTSCAEHNTPSAPIAIAMLFKKHGIVSDFAALNTGQDSGIERRIL